MHEKPAVTQPCCIPSKLSAFNVIIRNNMNIEDYLFERLIVETCSCQ
ncbi:hypothetical protein MXB_4294 [Myxobolus squamalis]|nr:hypothetical protein MXB_4294 [Myxobolus squamalis]